MRRHSQINVRQHSLGDLVIPDRDDMDGARLRITVRRQAGNGFGVLNIDLVAIRLEPGVHSGGLQVGLARLGEYSRMTQSRGWAMSTMRTIGSVAALAGLAAATLITAREVRALDLSPVFGVGQATCGYWLQHPGKDDGIHVILEAWIEGFDGK
jgi:hypothetical protein